MPLFAQTEAQADALFQAGRYADAGVAYNALLKRSPSNALYLYRVARCQQECGQVEEAIASFEKAGERYALRNFFLGQLYIEAYRFDEAVAALEKYLSKIAEDHDRYAPAQAALQRAEKLSRQLLRTEDVLFLRVDTLPLAAWTQHIALSSEAGSIEENGFVNAKGDWRIYSENGHLYSVVRLLDAWAEPERLPMDGTHPFLSQDGVTLFFSAPGEIGGQDIFVTRLNSDTQQWLQPVEVGMPVSSLGDDLFYGEDEEAGKGWIVSAQGDRALIYTFELRDQKKYLRDASSDERREMALRRKMYAPAASQPVQPAVMQPLPLPDTNGMVAFEEDFYLVINDTTIYTVWDDFRSAKARSGYEKYVELTAEQQEEEALLTTFRRAWGMASEEQNEAEMTKLSLSIIALEKKAIQTKKTMDEIIQTVRLDESQEKK